MAGIHLNFSQNFTGTQQPIHGKGREVARTFEEAKYFQFDGLSASNTLCDMGLRAVASQDGTTEREKWVAKIALEQSRSLDANVTVGCFRNVGREQEHVQTTS